MIHKIWAAMRNKRYVTTIKYGLVGLMNTVVGYGIYLLLIGLRVFYPMASACGSVAGIINSYFWNKYFTFQSSKKSITEIIKFLFVYLIQYLCNIAIIYLCVNALSMSESLAGLFGICFGVLVSYFGHRFWTFRGV
jgi:putative flippase GtrA